MKRWNTGAPVFISLSRFADAVPLLYCADAFEIQKKCGLESSVVVIRVVAHIRAHAHREAPFVAVTKRRF